MKQKIKIDVVSDIVCPWCYIGKRRLEKAMAALQDDYTFDIEYHPFELNPEMPATGTNQRAYLTHKFGSESRYEEITNHTARVAALEGLVFDFKKQQVSPNTRKLHLLLQYAKLSGKQPELVEAFFKAYFTDGTDLSKDDNIVSIAAAHGLDTREIRTLLENNDALKQIELAESEVSKLGISGVPFYIINNRYGLSGAQPSGTFADAIRQIGKEREASEAGACDIDGKNC